MKTETMESRIADMLGEMVGTDVIDQDPLIVGGILIPDQRITLQNVLLNQIRSRIPDTARKILEEVVRMHGHISIFKDELHVFAPMNTKSVSVNVGGIILKYDIPESKTLTAKEEQS